MFHAVIPAGGSGTRLWPLSRPDHPKFLLPLAAALAAGPARSLLEATVDRLAPLVGPERTYVVTGTRAAAAVAAELPALPAENLLVEPSPRDSAAAIGLAAAVIDQRDPDAVMGSFAADQLVRDPERFAATIRAAITGAERGFLMTVGMSPTRPETGFGYVQCGDPVDAGPLRRVRQFKEKPDLATAEKFVASGDYLWNASMFVWRVSVFLSELARANPALHAGLARIAAAWDTPERDGVLAAEWPALPRIAVDYAVMEPAAERGMVATVPGDFGWMDIGDFRNLGEVLPADGDGNVVAAGPADLVTLRDAAGSVVVPAAGRRIALLGVTDLVVVDTPDALLVCPRDRAQDVKRLAEDP